MTTVNANDVVLGIESFGDDDAPLVLLAGGTTMLSWPDALCERLAAGGRRVVRYDLRDSGESTTADPGGPTTPCATSQPTPPPLPTRWAAGQRTSPGSASQEWSPR
jgi:pimeloyl-ACP methyl ester carboxylesterase